MIKWMEKATTCQWPAASILVIIVLLTGCSTTRETSKYQLSDDYYTTRLFDHQKQHVYIDNNQDTVFIYEVKRRNSTLAPGSRFKMTLPQQASGVQLSKATFSHTSFDLDFITIPFKYRPTRQGFPRQFNTNLNGAAYVGYRSDFYRLTYRATPLKNFMRHTGHYGISAGFFSGLGGTTMNPSVTGSQLNYEYDGVVWSKGVAGIVGINKVTIGLAVGYDHLLDKNKQYWLYQGKPWLGLAFGINLN